jgi:hypothetical protein
VLPTWQKIDENGLNGYQQLARDSRPKQIATMAKKGERCAVTNKVEWNRYRNFVEWLGINNKAVILGDNKTGKMGTVGAYQVDHIYSVINGFNNKVSPWVISHINNMQLLPWEQNSKKTHNSGMTLDDLMTKCHYEMDKSSKEFAIFMQIVSDDNGMSSSSRILEIYNERTDNAKFRHK